eukprot:m.32796 g.32796  ORF g.32796 m.32796 type:complete len:475 (+) comp10158_c0_seq2:46-1470(+)
MRRWLLLVFAALAGLEGDLATQLESPASPPRQDGVVWGTWDTATPQSFEFRDGQRHHGQLPATRYNHVTLYDPARRRVLLLMGYLYDHQRHHATWLDDVWEFDVDHEQWRCVHAGTTWGAQPPAGSGDLPRARYGPSAVLHADSVWVFGGDDGKGTSRPHDTTSTTTALDDLWELRLGTMQWHHHPMQQQQHNDADSWPLPRSLHAACVLRDNSGDAHMLIFGGVGLGDAWVWSFRERRWETFDGVGSRSSAGVLPGPRHGTALTVTGDGQRAYMFGGARVRPLGLYNDLWEVSLEGGWRQLRRTQSRHDALHTLPLSPVPRSYHGAAITSVAGIASDVLVVFAGANCSGSCVCFDDAWALAVSDDDRGAWSAPWQRVTLGTGQQPPSTRYHPTLVSIEPERGVLYAFGGESYRPVYMYHNAMLRLTLTAVPSVETRTTALSAIAALSLIALVMCCILCKANSTRPYRKPFSKQ